MRRHLYSIEIQGTKDDFVISLFKKGLPNPLFSILYRKFNACKRYAFVKNKLSRSGITSYELISCYYCGKHGTSLSAIRKSSKGKHRLVRIIKNTKLLYSEFKRTLKLITSSFANFKYKSVGNLKVYSINDNGIIRIFENSYNNLHKIR